MNRTFFAKFMLVLGFVMVAIYFALGMVLMFSPIFKYIPQNMRIIFGIFFCAYSLFRLVRTYMKLKEQKHE